MGNGCMKITTSDQILPLPKNHSINYFQKEDSLHKKSRKSFKDFSTYNEVPAANIMHDTIKSSEEIGVIIAALNSHFIFISLSDEDKATVAERMLLYHLPADAIIYEQGRHSSNFFVVKSGRLEEIENGKLKSKIETGDGFGEMALLNDSPRESTVRTIERCILWAIERNHLRKVIEECNMQLYDQNREFLNRVSLLQPLTSEQKDSLAASLVTKKYSSGQKIITQGETGSELFIVKEGTVGILKDAKEVARVHSGMYIGELALLNNPYRTASCIAVDGEVKCMSLSKDTLEKVLKGKLEEIIHKNTVMEAFERSEYLRKLTHEQRDKLAAELETHDYKAGDIVIHVNTLCTFKLYVVVSGKLYYARNSVLFADKGMCVGDKFIIENSEEAIYQDDIIATCDTKVGELTKYLFNISIGGNYHQVVSKNSFISTLKKEYLFSTLGREEIGALFNKIDKVEYNDLMVILTPSMLNNSIFIVKKGQVNVYMDGRLVRIVSQFDYFGERELYLEAFGEITCVAHGRVNLWVIHHDDFRLLLGKEEILSQLKLRLKYENSDATLNDLEIIKLLGKGSISKVYLSRSSSGDLFALKAVPRNVIDKLVLQERLIVTSI